MEIGIFSLQERRIYRKKLLLLSFFVDNLNLQANLTKHFMFNLDTEYKKLRSKKKRKLKLDSL